MRPASPRHRARSAACLPGNHAGGVSACAGVGLAGGGGQFATTAPRMVSLPIQFATLAQPTHPPAIAPYRGFLVACATIVSKPQRFRGVAQHTNPTEKSVPTPFLVLATPRWRIRRSRPCPKWG